MQRLRVCLAGIAVIFLSLSCIDKDILNVSDSLDINSSYSIPLGTFSLNINDYLESLARNSPSRADSIYFEDILYPNPDTSAQFGSVDTFALNIVRDYSEIKSMEMVVLVTNFYPAECMVQVYFDSGFTPFDSLFADGPVKIPPAEINDEENITHESTRLFSITMSSEFNRNLSAIHGIIIKGLVKTTGPDHKRLKFYPDQKINVHIGSRVELLMQTN